MFNPTQDRFDKELFARKNEESLVFSLGFFFSSLFCPLYSSNPFFPRLRNKVGRFFKLMVRDKKGATIDSCHYHDDTKRSERSRKMTLAFFQPLRRSTCFQPVLRCPLEPHSVESLLFHYLPQNVFFTPKELFPSEVF